VGRIEERERTLASGRSLEVRTVLAVQRGARRFSLMRTLRATFDGAGALREAELVAPEITSRVLVQPRALLFTVEVQGHAFTHRLPVAGPVHLEETALRGLAASGLRPGKRHRVTLFDLEHGRMRPVLLRVGERRRWHGLEGSEVIFGEAHGIEWRALVDSAGRVIRSESLIPGVETRRWKPGDEERPLHAVDLGAWGAVMTSGEIRAPERVQRLRLALRGLPPGLGMPGELDLRRPAFPEVPPRAAAAGPMVRPAPFLESDAPEVVALAREIVPAQAAPAEAARRVAGWLQANIRQGDAIGPPSALATLRTRRGNCNEIAALATALLRASGFPSRVAFGIAYYRGAFRYHAWPEVRHGDAWVPFDPTFGQIPADATHVRLAAGGVDAQAAVLYAAGRLTVEILEVEEEPR
jgi:hypothetical protein